MDIDKTIEDAYCLNVMCSSLGNTSDEFFNNVVATLNRSLTRIALSAASQNDLREKSKKELPARDWSKGYIKCHYRTKSPQVDWAECQIHYRCHASIIVANAADYDVSALNDDMQLIRKIIGNEQIYTYLVLVFNCGEDKAIAFKDDRQYALFAPQPDNQIPTANVEREIERLIYITALHFFNEMARLKNDNHTIPLFNSKEDIIEDPSKIRKRKQGRSIKVRGDLALMLACYRDAYLLYSQAQEALKTSEDNIWMGKIYEAQASCMYLEYQLSPQSDKENWDIIFKVVGGINERIKKAIEHYQRARSMKAWDFNTDCYLKWFRLLRSFDARKSFNEAVCSYMEVPEHRLNVEKHCKITIEVSSIYYKMKMPRKTAFFLKLTADTILQSNLNPSLARDLYLASFPLYSLPLTKDILPESFPKQEFLSVIKANNNISQFISRVSPTLQLQLINDVLAISVGDVPMQTKLVSIILHHFLKDINYNYQQGLYNHLIALGNLLNKSLKLDLTYLPEVVKAAPVLEVLKVNVKQLDSGNNKSNIFIYNPWKKGSATLVDFNWMVGNMCYVKIFLRNIFDFEVVIDTITLVTEGVRTINYPTSIIMNKTRSLHELTLKFKPLETGTINVLGILSKLSNFVHFQPINAKGLPIYNVSPEKLAAKDSYGIRNVPIKQRVSTLRLWFEDTREEVELYESSRFHMRVIVENRSDCVMSLRRALVSFAFSDNTTLDIDVDVAEVDIEQYETFSIIICRTIKEEQIIVENLYGMQKNKILNLDNIKNLDRLFKIYVKLIYYEKDKPNISVEDNITKEIKMLKGLSLLNLQIYNSMISERITLSGKDYSHSSLEEDFCLNVDVIRDNPQLNKTHYMLSFHHKGTEGALTEKLMFGTHLTQRLIFRISRAFLKGQQADISQIKQMFYGRWKDLNSLDTGYLFLNDLEAEPLKEKIEGLNMKVSIETSIEGDDENKQAKIGQIYSFKVVLKVSGEEKRKFNISVIASGSLEAKKALMTKSEKGMIYKGKKNFLVDLDAGEQETTVSVNAMFLEPKQYRLFCFIIDEERTMVYSFSSPWKITVA